MHARLSAIGRALLGRRPPPVARFPIAILSFDRPHYFREVLLSLRPQVDEQDRIILFQDGAWNAYSKTLKTDPSLVEACVDLFREIVPWGTVAQSETNIGVAENYERAEQEVFGRLKAPYALFLEDDLVLGPHYLAVTRMLLDLARQEPRIAYVSASGKFWATAGEQEAGAAELYPMPNFVGFAMTRRAWRAERPFRRRYLQLVVGRDYGERNDKRIRRFYRKRGWDFEVTSQDGARRVAAMERGCVLVSTLACHAKYIRKIGIHGTEEHYQRTGYAASVLFTRAPAPLLPLTEAQIEAWLAEERQRFVIDPHARAV
jgi:hypothetical protein